MAQQLGSRIDQEIQVGERLRSSRACLCRKSAVLVAALCASLSFSCLTGGIVATGPASLVVVHTGNRSEFAKSDCVIAVELFERDARLSSHVESSIVSQLKLPQCSADWRRGVRIAYQAGPGTCIDCETSSRLWSGFAFITIADHDTIELGSAEWQGSGGRSAEALRDKFLSDMATLLGRTP